MKIVDRKIAELIPAEYNPRQLTDKQFNDIKKSLSKFGFVDPVIVNVNPDRKNIIIGGHQRTKVWESMGNKTIPVFEVDLTIDLEKELNVRLNKNTGDWDFDVLANWFDNDELKDWGFVDYELGMAELNADDLGSFSDNVSKASDEFSVTFVFNKEFEEVITSVNKSEITNLVLEYCKNK
jgi:ParB-like chromosome segregation protein Spo0J